MRIPETWPVREQRWDEFRAFYVGVTKSGTTMRSYSNGPLVLFETGELICLKSMPDPGERGTYEWLNVSLVISGDLGPTWTPDGAPVPAAWLMDNGSQWFLVDHDTDIAVRIDGSTTAHKSQYRPIPLRFQARAHGYIGGPGCKPVGCGRPVIIRPPLKSVTDARKAHLQGIRDALQAHLTLTEDPLLAKQKPWGEQPVSFLEGLKWKGPTDIPRDMILRVLHYGFDRPIVEAPYLLTRKP